MPLTDVQIKQAKPRDKDYWLTDEKGLRLLVKPNGGKYWRYKYRYEGKQKTLALGVYPDVPLRGKASDRGDWIDGARDLLEEARRKLKKGVDPSEHRKDIKRERVRQSGTAFALVAEDWWQIQKGRWSEGHAERVWVRLKENSFAILAKKPIADIAAQDVIEIVRSIEKRGAPEVAQRVLQDIRRVCRYAVQLGLLHHNPVAEVTAEVLLGRAAEHRPSLPREHMPEFLKALDEYQTRGRLLTKYALQLLTLTFVRPGELRGARWAEFDYEQKLWRIPAERMKMKTDHLVPLSAQALELLEQLQPISGRFELLFPSERRITEPMSDNTMRRAIFKLGYDGNTPGKPKCVPHGFRATASSILNEEGFNPDAIERQLAHMERNGVRAAYTHHARYLEERRAMMQWWGDYLWRITA